MSDTKDKKEDKKTHHPPFDGDDFEMWMERIMLKLQRKGLWEYCESEVTEPGESKEADHSKWLTESQRTREYLYDGMSDKIMKTVKYESTPCRIMERLKRRFVGKTYFKYAEEEVKLRQLRLYVNGNMSDHLGEVRRLMERISLLGKPLDDYLKPAFLMRSLPPEYDNVVEVTRRRMQTTHQTTSSWSRHLSSHTIDGKVARLKARWRLRR
ncbi:hypothetical protein PF010_g191 [Phytophthora fragariae]|uniref:Uncharacterized protein n=1 Tax=Phytophthora fragariae TaxID=53985 RepID=A0A6A3UTH8_9STRA|nr:hypothetical protein PF003_g20117 [Phytophthora fragariae]KAE8950341.1 hypothetical protein PF009_g195 [Phytophthora fragariae]KAE9140541.1 hypothetical protein PF010_g191 [Phytophthora fragariae]KAE9141533.1 hypothetical protein PF007_g196 [Phytophthora fragariae]KAE9155306.1 hypothetical protein PF006_g734 [Phytophthora fragariae]